MKIDLDAQLYRWRQLVTESGHVEPTKAAVARSGALLLRHPQMFRGVGALMRVMLRVLPNRLTRVMTGAWGATRVLPAVPEKSFRAWYRANRKDADTQ